MNDQEEKALTMTDTIKTPESGDRSPGEVGDTQIQTVSDMMEKLKLGAKEPEAYNEMDDFEALSQNLVTDGGNGTGAGDKEAKRKSLGLQTCNNNRMMKIKPMEARVIAEEIVTHLDDTLAYAFQDTTGIALEDWLTRCEVDNC